MHERDCRFDRDRLHIRPLSERKNLLDIRCEAVRPDGDLPSIGARESEQIERAVDRIRRARSLDRPVMLTYGAHLIKNGLAPVLIRLIERGWVTHLATNGAGSIHDWEFAFFGQSGESVRENVAQGSFGLWRETGLYINLAIALGGVDGLGYGASVGRMISRQALEAPSREELLHRIRQAAAPGDQIAAMADLLSMISDSGLQPGRIEIEHPYREFSVQCAAFEQGVPLTVHPGIGYDIIHPHPTASGGALGRAAHRDFLCFADSVSRIESGVHLSIGSAIMAPMVFEKSMAMANNLAIQQTGAPITNHAMVVVDIADGGGWDWSAGEPPKDNPAYYLRFCKSFNRMGGSLDYICLDNRAFLLHLCSKLDNGS